MTPKARPGVALLVKKIKNISQVNVFQALTNSFWFPKTKKPGINRASDLKYLLLMTYLDAYMTVLSL